MRVVFGADHAGFGLKQSLLKFVRDTLGHEVADVGTHSEQSCDYPLYAVDACELLLGGGADLGVLICGTGIGISVAANKVPGIVAARCEDTYSAHMAREHNGANVLCLGARVIGEGLAQDVVRVFLDSTEDPGANHARRRGLLRDLDARRQAGEQ
jgi:ribose 5-phosphate isomerase B